MYTLDKIVESWNQTATEVVLSDEEEEGVELQLEEKEDDESLPPPPAPPLEDEQISRGPPPPSPPLQKQQDGCGRRYMVGGVLLALVCIAAIVVVSVIAPERSTPSTVQASSSTVSENSYDSPPASREEAFQRLLTGISTPESWQTTGSPQSKALDWIVEYDSAQLDPSTANPRDVQERYILAVFYYAVGGAKWFDSFYFLSQSHVCDWNNVDFGLGVQCDEATKAINGFKFGPNNLQGYLPDEIFLLESLISFQIIMNPGLSGPIPSTVDKLNNLEVLNLNKNSLNGEIPDKLLSLPSLTTLWMDENSFEGTIPNISEDETTLQWWSCNNCGLTGRMPDSLSIPVLPSL
jgi:hypothetical protein